MMKLPKDYVCEYPAYLFWKLQSRLTKLANHLEKIHKPSTLALPLKPEPEKILACKD